MLNLCTFATEIMGIVGSSSIRICWSIGARPSPALCLCWQDVQTGHIQGGSLEILNLWRRLKARVRPVEEGFVATSKSSLLRPFRIFLVTVWIRRFQKLLIGADCSCG